MRSKLAIIGLGLIGSSMGMALKRSVSDHIEIVGHDKEPTAASKAKKMGAVDRTDWNLLSAVQDADIVILATPPQAIGQIMRETASHLSEHCVVTDTGSSKAQIMDWAGEHLPRSVSFVGGHPMAGKEQSGPDAADPDLFQGATYCIIPGVRANQEAVQVVVGLATMVGAKPFFMDAVEHDSFVAAVSHLPIVVSAALVSATNKSPSWREISRLVATGFKDVTRLASGDPEMNTDICCTNKEYINYWIDAMVEELREYKRLINESQEDLFTNFVRVWEARERVMKQVDMTEESRSFDKIPSAADAFLGNYVNSRLAENWARMTGDGKGERKKGR